jgi:hypothetical protein
VLIIGRCCCLFSHALQPYLLISLSPQLNSCSEQAANKLAQSRQQVDLLTLLHAFAGVFPMVVNFWMALGSTIYITANCCVLYYFRHPGCAWMATLVYLMQKLYTSYCWGRMTAVS